MPFDYEQIARENYVEYGKGVGRLGRTFLSDLYSDPAHFVYELLQNAEDALKERDSLATRVVFPRAAKFVLFDDRLEFRHFGIPFAEKHIRAICDIARSSKQDNPNAIGHFGIGFKSVYGFSQRPEVHSGNESFAIEKFVRPIEVEKRATTDGETLFYLPFNHLDVTASECHRVISDRLRSLGSSTLLFLSQLKEIDWRVDGGGSGRYVRTSKEDTADVNRVSLVGEENDNPAEREEWLLFSRAVEGNGTSSGKVQIAYRLQQDKQNRRGQIQRTKDSPLCVYFATDLQTNLGFLVQGPFRLTPSRDNIKKEDKWNKSLVKEVGKLAVESLSKLKKLGLLSVSALDAMPLEREDFETDTGKLFLPVFDAVLQALKKQPLIPGLGKIFVSGSSGVLVRGRELASLFNSEQLTTLLRSDERREWISPDITADKKITKRLHTFLRGEVDVYEFDADDLPRGLDEDFLKTQSVAWHSRLYKVLLKNPSLWSDDDGALRNVEIIRLADGSNVAPFGYGGEANAFLPADGECGPKTVHPHLLKGDARTFLRKLGLRPRDSVAEIIGDILPQFTISIPGRSYGVFPSLSSAKQQKGKFLRLVKPQNNLGGRSSQSCETSDHSETMKTEVPCRLTLTLDHFLQR
ncbi:MAG: hypothetical protein O3C40_33365 [Planctomycetota bacterium]|nr:hypothetical protein [Planctomycetota bacterium]